MGLRHSFQFHWMDSKNITSNWSRSYRCYLSIPLNGFSYTPTFFIAFVRPPFQFHWMDSTAITITSRLFWTVILSIPLNGFSYIKLSDTEVVKLSFNSIEWIPYRTKDVGYSTIKSLFQFHWMDSFSKGPAYPRNVFSAFNSIEWILARSV